MRTTWRKEITAALADYGNTWDDVLHVAGDGSLDIEFNDGYGGPEGRSFAVWTAERVYFPCCYDGSEWVGSVPRNPSDEPIDHIGGF